MLFFLNMAVRPGNVSALFYTEDSLLYTKTSIFFGCKLYVYIFELFDHVKWIHIIKYVIYGICKHVQLILITEQIILHMIADMIFPFGVSAVCSAAAGELSSDPWS